MRDLSALPELHTATDLLAFLCQDPQDRFVRDWTDDDNGVAVYSLRALGVTHVDEFSRAYAVADSDGHLQSKIVKSRLAIVGTPTGYSPGGSPYPPEISQLFQDALEQSANRQLSCCDSSMTYFVLPEHAEAQQGVSLPAEQEAESRMGLFSRVGYPASIVERFADVVTRHIESLPSDYYKRMREFTENGNWLPEGEASIYALGFDFAEDYKRMLPPRFLVEKYTSCIGACITELLEGYDTPESVGEINGQPILFLRAPGQYHFETADAKGVLSVGLTGAFYPPVWPTRIG